MPALILAIVINPMLILLLTVFKENNPMLILLLPVQVPFPMGVNVRTRPGKARTSAFEEIHQGSPPNLGHGDDSSQGEAFGSAKESD